MLPRHANGAGVQLFRRYDPFAGKDVLFWARCIYTLGRKLRIEQHHATGCDGWDKTPRIGFTSRYLARCGCPVEMLDSRYVWLIMPKRETVTLEDGKVITHGLEHKVTDKEGKGKGKGKEE